MIDVLSAKVSHAVETPIGYLLRLDGFIIPVRLLVLHYLNWLH